MRHKGHDAVICGCDSKNAQDGQYRHCVFILSHGRYSLSHLLFVNLELRICSPLESVTYSSAHTTQRKNTIVLQDTIIDVYSSCDF